MLPTVRIAPCVKSDGLPKSHLVRRCQSFSRPSPRHSPGLGAKGYQYCSTGLARGRGPASPVGRLRGRPVEPAPPEVAEDHAEEEAGSGKQKCPKQIVRQELAHFDLLQPAPAMNPMKTRAMRVKATNSKSLIDGTTSTFSTLVARLQVSSSRKTSTQRRCRRATTPPPLSTSSAPGAACPARRSSIARTS